jgi:hypothetical protein
MTRYIAILALVLLTALAAAGEETAPVLGTDGAVYTADSATGRLNIVRRVGRAKTRLLVPTTGDKAIESQANLMWDAKSSALFVLWTRTSENGEQILMARLDPGGNWSEPLDVAPESTAKRVGLQAIMTRSVEGDDAILAHAVWWSMTGDPVAEYALVAFERGQLASTSISDLDTLAAVNSAQALSLEPVLDVLHPPLTMTRSGAGVDVLFGAHASTAVTRVRITPKPVPNARIWKPVGRSGERLPHAKIASSTGAPVRALISEGRVILYTPESTFRFVIYDEGRWSPERVIQLSEGITNDQLERELRETVEQLRIAAEPDGARQ